MFNSDIMILVLFVVATSLNEDVFMDIVGTIYSPNYPENYGNNARKTYIIKPPQRSEILLMFNHFDLEDEDSLQASTTTCKL